MTASAVAVIRLLIFSTILQLPDCYLNPEVESRRKHLPGHRPACDKGPIDMVFTWVNGSDPAFIELKEKYGDFSGMTKLQIATVTC